MNAAQYFLVCVWGLGDMRLVWVYGIENRQATTVLPCAQASFEDLRALTGGSRVLNQDPPSYVFTPTKLKSSLPLSSEPTSLDNECDKLSTQVTTRKATGSQSVAWGL